MFSVHIEDILHCAYVSFKNELYMVGKGVVILYIFYLYDVEAKNLKKISFCDYCIVLKIVVPF